MNIAFYAPMKSPCHPVPSGDRLMARQLLGALRTIGADVRLASELRSYSRNPNPEVLDQLRKAGRAQAGRLIAQWQAESWRPDIWFCYHPYYKAPDLIGPTVCQHFSARYATAEASFAARRSTGDWSSWLDELRAGLQISDVHFYMKERDLAGLEHLTASQTNAGRAAAQLVHLPPFIDVAAFANSAAHRDTHGPVRLATVAMMRADVKLRSYRFLAAALARVRHLDWHLDIVGDGDARHDVEAAFAVLAGNRVTFHGRLEVERVRDVLARCHAYVWPGFGEAYGLAYLEAQAAGCPVIAQRTAGVPEVVRDGETGLLTPKDDEAAFATALQRIICNRALAAELGAKARRFVQTHRSLATAHATLNAALPDLVRS